MAVPCGHHEIIDRQLIDHENRLRDKTVRLQKLELEMEGMSEKMDLLIVNQDKTQASVDSLKAWQTGIMAVFGVALLVVDKWEWIMGFVK
jgi:hypothetical protein